MSGYSQEFNPGKQFQEPKMYDFVYNEPSKKQVPQTLDELDGMLTKTQDMIRSAYEENFKQRSAQAHLQVENEKFFSRLKDAEKKITELTTQTTVLDGDNQLMVKEIESLKTELDKARHDYSKDETEIEKLKVDATHLKLGLEEERKRGQFQAETLKASNEYLTSCLASMQASLKKSQEARQRQAEEHEQQIIEIRERQQLAYDGKQMETVHVEVLRKQVQQLLMDLEVARAETRNKESLISDMKETLTHRIEAEREILKSEKERCAQLEFDCERLKNYSHNIEKELASLREENIKERSRSELFRKQAQTFQSLADNRQRELRIRSSKMGMNTVDGKEIDTPY